MKHFIVRLVILTIASVFLTSLTALGEGTYKKSFPTHAKSALKKAKAYSLPLDRKGPGGVTSGERIPLGVDSYDNAASPGQTVGWTYYDWQHNGSIGRMIETGPHSGYTGPAFVHFGWTHLSDSTDFNVAGRTYMYNAYRSSDGTFAGAYRLNDYDDEYAGFVNVDVTPDNRALVGGHCDQKGPIEYAAQIYFDNCPACELFDYYVRIEDSIIEYVPDYSEAMWPKFFYQFGVDTVLHVLALWSGGAEQYPLGYFRLVGYEGSPDTEWDYPPRVVDTIPGMSHDITGERTGNRVAIAWTASLPYQEPYCDTCSGISFYDGYLIGQMDNDLYYQTSYDQGITWEPRVNLTKNPIGAAAYKPYADLSMLIDTDGNLHLVWTACPWEADLCIEEGGFCFEEDWYVDAARLFHWSENVPYTRAICDHTYEPIDSCWADNWALRVARPTISECEGNLFVIWTQFNDIPGGILNDCAAWGFVDPLMASGAANGDLWYAVSEDGGMMWSPQVNLTNSYTPHCDPSVDDDCQSDYWPSMNRFGRAVQTGEDWSQAAVVDPSGGGAGSDYYLDVQYVNDLDAGGVVVGNGSWTNNPVKWFRIPCMATPPPDCIIHYSDSRLTILAMMGTSVDTNLVLYNWGNMDAEYTITIDEGNGPAGWLSVSGFSGTVPAGLNNTDEGTIHIDLQNASWEYFGGQLIFDGNCSSFPNSIEIEVWAYPWDIFWHTDTVHTDCQALIVSNNGNMGKNGFGKVNMDYYRSGDCDTTATIYMYDGSPVVGWIADGDTVFNYSTWGIDPYSDIGLVPLREYIETKYCSQLDAEIYESGAFLTHNEGIGLEKIWLAPSDDCPFIIQYMRVWSYDGSDYEDLLLGEVIDWDVPWDYIPEDEDHYAVNYGAIDITRNLVYQQGYESPSDTGYPYDCQFNDERFAGHAFVQSYLNGSPRAPVPYAAFVNENDSVQADNGFDAGDMWQLMVEAGMRGTDSTEDLHTVMTYEPALDLSATDVYEVVTVMATVHQGSLADLQAAVDAGIAWYTANGGLSLFADDNGDGQVDLCEGCCVVPGDADHSGTADALDIVYLVDYFWKGGPPPPCMAEADFNGDCRVDPMDLVGLVEWMWKWGPDPVACPNHCEYD